MFNGRRAVGGAFIDWQLFGSRVSADWLLLLQKIAVGGANVDWQLKRSGLSGACIGRLML
jgi:hypothetical protein